MIEEPTVFVLGAGASAVYGFPTGGKLRDEIVQGLLSGRDLRGARVADLSRVLQELGHSKEQIGRFAERPRLSAHPSVDVFLEHNPDCLPLGKRAIAITLMRYEQESQLFRNGLHWYRYVRGRLGATGEEVAQSNVVFVTFNYDRSLEHFLFQAIRHAEQDMTDDKARAVLQEVPVLHVYGQLAKLPWQENADSSNSRAYSSDRNPETVAKAADGIVIMRERDQPSPGLVEARQRIRDAKWVVFLGFGYYEENLRRLGLDGCRDDVAVLGTTFGMGHGEYAQAHNLLEDLLPKGQDNVSAQCKPEDSILTFFRERTLLT
ncbi:MAG: hypothetical protein R6V05_08505 [Candidatus Brocadiia bacterium]